MLFSSDIRTYVPTLVHQRVNSRQQTARGASPRASRLSYNLPIFDAVMKCKFKHTLTLFIEAHGSLFALSLSLSSSRFRSSILRHSFLRTPWFTRAIGGDRQKGAHADFDLFDKTHTHYKWDNNRIKGLQWSSDTPQPAEVKTREREREHNKYILTWERACASRSYKTADRVYAEQLQRTRYICMRA